MSALDAAALERARKGDVDAFGVLWRHFQAPLLRYLRAKRMSQPEDIASQVWIDIAGSIAGFEGDENDFRRLLFTVAHRRSVDDVRRSVRRPETLSDRAGENVPSQDAAADYADATSLSRALAIVQTLPADMAEAVMLRVVNDMPISDVAAIMSRTEGSVRVLVHRGLKRLSLAQSVTNDSPPTMKVMS